MKRKLVIATRSSQLALWQANWIKERLEKTHSELEVELKHIKTKGDKILDTPLAMIGGKGLFVKELEVEMLEGRADIAVHSMKDVPVDLPEGLEISVITKRENPSDAFVSNRHKDFGSLPKSAKVGTSSLRRVAQLQKARPDLEFVSLRGNVNSRLRKLDEGQFDAIILAAAGLIRLGMGERITSLLSHDECLPAIGQGVVSIESRSNDHEVLDLIDCLKHEETTICVEAERAFLTRLNGGCQVPLGGHAVLSHKQVILSGLIARPDGRQVIRFSEQGAINDAGKIGVVLAERMLEKGGREILKEVGIEVK
ncbi:MAG: hydroxymethylbilane synthase [Deltaproteobacteria bacterium]|nr:hydroxymethylbilane synthase [Deltaproteobacteria bacterium]